MIRQKRRWYGIFWIVLSIFWLDVTGERLHGLLATGRAVTFMQYVDAAFWLVLLIFWAGFTWKNWSNEAPVGLVRRR